MLILLPPSEGKARPEAGDPVDLDALVFAAELGEKRAQLLDAFDPSLREAPGGAGGRGLHRRPLQTAGAARAAGGRAEAGADRQRALGRGAAR